MFLSLLLPIRLRSLSFMLANSITDSPRYVLLFFSSLGIPDLVLSWPCFILMLYTCLTFMLFILALSVELSRLMSAQYYLFGIHATLLPPADHSRAPTIDFLSCRAGWEFRRFERAPGVQSCRFPYHFIWIYLYFVFSDSLYYYLYLKKPCTLILHIRSSNTDKCQVLGWVFDLLFCLIFVSIIFIVAVVTYYGCLPRDSPLPMVLS